MNEALNAICPYYTMFPLVFPKTILDNIARPGDVLLDPFCGRGTSNFAGRLAGMDSYGVDSNPVATALASAKLIHSTSQAIVRSAKGILAEIPVPNTIPSGEFWELAYDAKVLKTLCRLRQGLLNSCSSNSRKALRGIILGALHGPKGKVTQSYFSNQSPRTFAPKPRYAVGFWKDKQMQPPDVDVLGVIKARAVRFYADQLPSINHSIVLGDSRSIGIIRRAVRGNAVGLIITSPPYYGMRTYVADQWLRYWFVGGPDHVDYSCQSQVKHSSADVFATQLSTIWKNTANVARTDARLIARFGAINDRKIDPIELFTASLQGTRWRIDTIESAGTSSHGKRQADQFCSTGESLQEYDFWCSLA